MDQKQPLLHLFTVLLFLSFLLHLAGSHALKNQAATGIQEENQAVDGDEIPIEEQGILEGRMDFERMDYAGSGANSRHDPKNPPGRA